MKIRVLCAFAMGGVLLTGNGFSSSQSTENSEASGVEFSLPDQPGVRVVSASSYKATNPNDSQILPLQDNR